MNLSYIPPTIVNGDIVLQLEKEEFEKEIKKQSSALIVYVVGNCPGYNFIKKYVKKIWNKVAEPTIFLYEEG